MPEPENGAEFCGFGSGESTHDSRDTPQRLGKQLVAGCKRESDMAGSSEPRAGYASHAGAFQKVLGKGIIVVHSEPPDGVRNVAPRVECSSPRQDLEPGQTVEPVVEEIMTRPE